MSNESKLSKKSRGKEGERDVRRKWRRRKRKNKRKRRRNKQRKEEGREEDATYRKMFKFDILGVQERRKGGRERGRDKKEEEEGSEEGTKRKVETFQGIWTKLRITGLFFQGHVHVSKQVSRQETR